MPCACICSSAPQPPDCSALARLLNVLQRHYDLAPFEYANWGKLAVKKAAKTIASKKLTGEL